MWPGWALDGWAEKNYLSFIYLIKRRDGGCHRDSTE